MFKAYHIALRLPTIPQPHERLGHGSAFPDRGSRFAFTTRHQPDSAISIAACACSAVVSKMGTTLSSGRTKSMISVQPRITA